MLLGPFVADLLDIAAALIGHHELDKKCTSGTWCRVSRCLWTSALKSSLLKILMLSMSAVLCPNKSK
jgi:hypothetical protein